MALSQTLKAAKTAKTVLKPVYKRRGFSLKPEMVIPFRKPLEDTKSRLENFSYEKRKFPVEPPRKESGPSSFSKLVESFPAMGPIVDKAKQGFKDAIPPNIGNGVEAISKMRFPKTRIGGGIPAQALGAIGTVLTKKVMDHLGSED